MSNDTAKTITTNIVPVQGTFEPLPPYECINLIGPAGTPFFAPTNPNLDGVSITNSTINSTTIGVTTPALGAFTTASSTNQPVGNNDLTTKLYVDSLALGISWKQPVIVGTTVNITLSGLQTIDTVSVLAGERVLVKNQTNQAQNGIYDAAVGPWTRSPDANTWDELISALVFIVEGGQSGAAYYCPIQPGGTLGVTPITWNNFSVGGVYFAGTGLNLSGGDTFNITNTGVTAATYGSASAVPAIAVNQQGQITSATNTSIAIAGSQVTSGTIDSARISGSYTGITAVGTLSGLTVSSTITGSISGNAATATTAGSATTATTATNLAGGATGSIPYQSGAGTTTFLAAGTNGQVLTLAGGVPTYATPTTGTVTSVGGTGTVSGISLSGTVTSSGNLTLGGTLDLSAPPAIGGTTANTVRGTTVTATTGFVGTNFDAAGSGGGNLRNASGTPQIQWGGGGGNNVSIDVATNINPANAAVAISPTGTGTVAISPAGALTVNPTTASTMNNVAIGGTTPLAGTFTDLRVNNTISLAGTTGTAGFVLTSNGASAPTWQANANGLAIVDDTTTNATRYLTFTNATTGNITTANVSSTKLSFNPSTGFLGTTGVSFGAGTVSAPAITTTGDTNTGIFFPAADTIAFSEGGTESARFDSNGNFLIGTTNSDVGGSVAGFRVSQSGGVISCIDGSGLLHYQSPLAADRRNTAGDGVMYGMWRAGNYQCGIGATSSSAMTFFTGNNSSQTERMRIDSSGNLLVGITSTLLASGSCFVNDTTAGDSPQLILRNAQNTAGRYWKVGAVGGAGGANPYMIVYNASNAGVYMGYGDTNWSSTSDESKKENLVPITDAITKISSLRTVIGNFTADEEKTKHPFLIAQDVQKVLPEAVNEKDGVLGLKYSDMIPLIVASIKELNAKLDTQSITIQELKATVDAQAAQIAALENPPVES